MRALAAASRLSARLLSSSISAAVAASFGGGAARNSRPDEMTHVFQVPAFGSIRSPATCWASALGISSNAQSPLRRTLASETRFIAFSLVGCHARHIARGCTLRMLVALAKNNVGFDSSMPADGTQHSSLHPNEISACPVRGSCSKSRLSRFTAVVPIQPASDGELGKGRLVQSPLPKCWPCRDGCVYALPKHAHADYLIRSIGLPDRGLVVHSGAGLSWSAGSPPFLPRMSRVIRV